MTQTELLKLRQVLKNNRTTPLIIGTVSQSDSDMLAKVFADGAIPNISAKALADDVISNISAHLFADAVTIDASILEADLHKSNAYTPPWMQETAQKTENGAFCYLVIDALDTLPTGIQHKFLPLLKDRRAGLYKLPPHVQIIMPVRHLENISDKIKAVSLSWTVK